MFLPVYPFLSFCPVSLNLAGNSFYGNLPSELGLLTSLALVDLSKFLHESITNWILVTYFFNLGCIALGMNDDLKGMVPIELKELTELQDLHLSGTALNGSLSPIFCIGDSTIINFEADCVGGVESEVLCFCCTLCCGRIDDEPYSCVQNTPFASALIWLLEAEADLDRMALSSLGTPQHQALNWLVYHDPAMLDFETTPPRIIVERYVIVTLYYSSNGPQWRDQRGFLRKESVCKWRVVNAEGTSFEGVGCNEDEFVDDIKLNAEGILDIAPLFSNVTVLPPEIGFLNNITFLSLGKSQKGSFRVTAIGISLLQVILVLISPFSLPANMRIGPILPTELGMLTTLVQLDLRETQLTGKIPTELVLLTNLEELDLGENQLTGKIPSKLGLLTTLEELDLSGNQLTGNIPSEIGRLTTVKELDLRGNQVTGGIPSEIGFLTSLTLLDLSKFSYEYITKCFLSLTLSISIVLRQV
jgi:hypothetical protein